mmetsp:Transcript_18748/g.27777  ORF Transcript_18748/g.27777 Transcript_18748/m.27777 type:complete len:133 (-) Transcript_18748:290-688(-)
MHKSRYTLIAFIALLNGANGSSLADDFNLPLEKDLKLFGVNLNSRRISTQMAKNSEMTQEVKGIRRPDDFEEAEQHFFDVIERAEKKVINVARTLVQDEVDILFGKDHGHAIHDDPGDKLLSANKQAPVWLL